MSHLSIAEIEPRPRRRYSSGLGQADLVGGLVGGAVGIYTQSVQMKHDAAMAKKSLQAQLIVQDSVAKTQQAADEAAAARTTQLVQVAKVIGVGAGFLFLLSLLLGGRRRRGPAAVAGGAPLIIVRRAETPAAKPTAVPVKTNPRRRYARVLG